MRVAALDVGDKRIGVAVSDPLGLVAGPLAVLQRRNLTADVQALGDLLRREEVGRLVVGIPYGSSGQLGPQGHATMAFRDELVLRLPIPVEIWDESFSTVAARRVLQAQGVRARKQRARVDAVAASVILQDYLDQAARASSVP